MKQCDKMLDKVGFDYVVGMGCGDGVCGDKAWEDVVGFCVVMWRYNVNRWYGMLC